MGITAPWIPVRDTDCGRHQGIADRNRSDRQGPIMTNHSHQAASLQPRSDSRDQEGVALIFALFFSVIALGITIAGTLFMNAHRDATTTRFATNGQALEFARSGLIEALGWFRKQTSQPVTTFTPNLSRI